MTYFLNSLTIVQGRKVIADMALKSEIMLVSQERAKDLEYRVIPVNNSDPGAPRNSVDVKR